MMRRTAALLLVALAHQGKIKTIIKLALVFGPRPLLLGLEEKHFPKSQLHSPFLYRVYYIFSQTYFEVSQNRFS